MQHWYVYYKLPRSECAALLDRVRRLQQAIAADIGVRVRLLERVERSETTTVMEVYEDIDDAGAFGARLDAAVHAHLPHAHLATRRVERFRDA